MFAVAVQNIILGKATAVIIADETNWYLSAWIVENKRSDTQRTKIKRRERFKVNHIYVLSPESMFYRILFVHVSVRCTITFCLCTLRCNVQVNEVMQMQNCVVHLSQFVGICAISIHPTNIKRRENVQPSFTFGPLFNRLKSQEINAGRFFFCLCLFRFLLYSVVCRSFMVRQWRNRMMNSASPDASLNRTN